jgi:hypothetical protein
MSGPAVPGMSLRPAAESRTAGIAARAGRETPPETQFLMVRGFERKSVSPSWIPEWFTPPAVNTARNVPAVHPRLFQ